MPRPPRNLTAALLAACLAAPATWAPAAWGEEPIHVYGAGGPAPAMKATAAAFTKETGIPVELVTGPTNSWLERAKANADLLFSGSETMMTDFQSAMGDRLDPASVEPLYLRPSAILVRPGNPSHIHGLKDLLKPGHRILVVNGSGQQGLWEDVAGRLGDMATVRAFRRNIARFAANSPEAKQAWIDDPSLDAWLIWTIWQVANPTLADQVPVEPAYRVYRDTGIILSRSGASRPEVVRFAEFLASPTGAKIFAQWGWAAAR